MIMDEKTNVVAIKCSQIPFIFKEQALGSVVLREQVFCRISMIDIYVAVDVLRMTYYAYAAFSNVDRDYWL